MLQSLLLLLFQFMVIIHTDFNFKGIVSGAMKPLFDRILYRRDRKWEGEIKGKEI